MFNLQIQIGEATGMGQTVQHGGCIACGSSVDEFLTSIPEYRVTVQLRRKVLTHLQKIAPKALRDRVSVPSCSLARCSADARGVVL